MLLSVVYSIVVLLISGCRPISPPSRELPDFTLTAVTADGSARFSRGALRGRIWIADFVFTRCSGPCPMLSANMAGLQKRASASIGLLSFSVDPDYDTPERLRAYARKFGADPRRWFFLTGEKAALARLVRDGFLLPVAENAAASPGQRVTHSTKFVLIDREARIRGWYDGEEPATLDKLAADAGRL